MISFYFILCYLRRNSGISSGRPWAGYCRAIHSFPRSAVSALTFRVNIQATFRQHAVNIQATFRQHAVNIQATFRQHAVNIQATFREHSIHSFPRSAVSALTFRVNIQATFR
jgi:hypothetical protein